MIKLLILSKVFIQVTTLQLWHWHRETLWLVPYCTVMGTYATSDFHVETVQINMEIPAILWWSSYPQYGSDTPRDKSIHSTKGLCKDKFLQTSYANTSILPQFKASTKSLEYWPIGCTPSWIYIQSFPQISHMFADSYGTWQSHTIRAWLKTWNLPWIILLTPTVLHSERLEDLIGSI